MVPTVRSHCRCQNERSIGDIFFFDFANRFWKRRLFLRLFYVPVRTCRDDDVMTTHDGHASIVYRYLRRIRIHESDVTGTTRNYFLTVSRKTRAQYAKKREQRTGRRYWKNGGQFVIQKTAR